MIRFFAGRSEPDASPIASRSLRTWIVPIFLLLVAGCDSAPGIDEAQPSAPRISGIVVSPDVLALDQLGGGDQVEASVDVSFDLLDEDDDLVSATVIIRSSSAGQTPLLVEEVPVGSSGRIRVPATVTFPRATAGRFIVTAFAVDTAGLISNTVYASLDVSGSSEPPVIDAIDMPTQVTRPAAGEPPISIPLVATVSDPDGLDNVAFVEVTVNGSTTLRLCDDGGQGACNSGFGSSGDATAGDGQFTLTIQLDASNSPGTNTFEFAAVDRTGLRSAVEVRTITVN